MAAWSQDATGSSSSGAPAGSSSGSSSAGGNGPGIPSTTPTPGGSASGSASSAFGNDLPAGGNSGSTSGPGSFQPAGGGSVSGSLPGGSTPSHGAGPNDLTPGATPTGPSGTLPGETRLREEAPRSFSISTGYGQAAALFTSGEGRLARPRFQARLTGSIGFDDNIFQTPTNAKGVPDQTLTELVTPGTPAQTIVVPVESPVRATRIGAIRPPPAAPEFTTVFIPAQDPVYKNVVIPGTAAPKRQASGVARATLALEMQTSNRRSVFTLDLHVSDDFYWNRPGKQEDYNGNFSLLYLYRLTPRLQVTASIYAAYLSQPDLTQINTPTRTGVGDYLNITSKFDLTYRWSPRFTTVSSFSYNRLSYEDVARQAGNYNNETFGTEFRYLYSPKLTLVLEGRYTATQYPNNSLLDATGYFALAGFDMVIARRAQATLRLGESVREYQTGGQSQASPYFEGTLNYSLGPRTTLQWNTRFGFEEPPDAQTKVLSLRSGLNISHSFSPRLRASLGIFASHRATSGPAGRTTEDTLDSSLGLDYTLNRHWIFNLNYSYTTVFDHPDTSSYFRNQIFTGFDYAF